MLVVTEDFFMANASLVNSFTYGIDNAEISWLQNNKGQLDLLENDACIDAYANALPTKYSDVVIIAAPQKQSDNPLLSSFTFDPKIP